MEHKTKPLGKKSPTSSSAKKPGLSKQGSSGSLGSPEDSRGTAPDSVFALDFLRQRLHEKIQMARGQGGTKELSAATLEKDSGESRRGNGRKGSGGSSEQSSRLQRLRKRRNQSRRPQNGLQGSAGIRADL